jgi:glutamine---fructose-6-phosphate transaminase (isomerizing)
MCGIVGYSGWKQAQPILFNSLAKLEYRGYDSCGIAIRGSPLMITKDAVRVAELSKSTTPNHGNTGIGHTRWATHGPPNKVNSHPHPDCTGRIAVVHNGVINNYQSLRKQLILEGHNFVSETDTEVISHLIEKYFKGNLEEAVVTAIKELEGSYAIIVIADNEPELVFARQDSPLIIGVGDRENFIASDVPAVLEYTNRVIYLEDGDTGVITPDTIKITHDGQIVKREEQKIPWTPDQARKGGYEHFMLKEIFEQPRVIRDTIAEYAANQSTLRLYKSTFLEAKNLLLLACGTSYHAALIGKYVAESLFDIEVRVETGSEFSYLPRVPHYPLTIGVTQSGETADTLKAMRRAKSTQSKLMAITNVVGCTASKLADYTTYTRAGPEISVAATKSFMAQLVALYWLTLSTQNLNSDSEDLLREFGQMPSRVQDVLDLKDIIIRSANKLAESENVFYVGRGLNYPVAMEGALKLKEISYIHAEAYAAGEIKHGPFALLSANTPVVAIIMRDNCHDAMLTTIKEIRARGSPVFAIVEDTDDSILDMSDFLIPIPSVRNIFTPFLTTVVIQMLAYYTAKKRGCPIDFPRNLAKSVTVE